MKFDELNQLKAHFGELRLSESDKEKRVSLGMIFYDILSYVFALMWIDALLNEDLDRDFYIDILLGRFIEAIEENDYPYEEAAVRHLVESVIDTNIEHYSEEEYFDDERALEVAENGSSAVNNYSDFAEAKKKGKKYKVWYAEPDERTRPAHKMMDNVRIPIDEYFYVDGDLMRFPHDDDPSVSIKNLANCRCECHYE